MRIKKLFGLLVVVALLASLLLGCSLRSQPYVVEPIPDLETTPLPDGTDSNEQDALEPESQDAADEIVNEAIPDLVVVGEPPADVTWVSPAKITIVTTDTYLGTDSSIAGSAILIHNSVDNPESTFSVTIGDGYGVGYEPLPLEYRTWVIISDPAPILLPGETKKVWIGFNIPVGTVDSPWIGKKYEVRTVVQRCAQEGNIMTAMAIRWLLDLR